MHSARPCRRSRCGIQNMVQPKKHLVCVSQIAAKTQNNFGTEIKKSQRRKIFFLRLYIGGDALPDFSEKPFAMRGAYRNKIRGVYSVIPLPPACRRNAADSFTVVFVHPF
jgi:hypothetical protein